jgi:cold shock CspA family protein
MLLEGRIKIYKDGTDGNPGGYGFIIPDFRSGDRKGGDIFFSIKHYSPKGEVPLAGDRVQYSEAPDAKRPGSVMAVGVQRIV